MTTTNPIRRTALVLAALAASMGTAAAERPLAPMTPGPTGPLHLDVEVDPVAYVMSGYSVHVGVGRGGQRIDLGVYAMDVPELLHGNEGWDLSLVGGGAKIQSFFLDDQRGFFVDLGVGVSVRELAHGDAGAWHRDLVVSLTASTGYRVILPHGLYLTPWVGLGYDLEDTDVMLAGRAFETSRATPFAAVHVGYRVPAPSW